VNELFRRHFIDQRDGVPQRVFHLLRIVGVNRLADVAKRRAKARAQLTVVLTPLDVLSVRFQR
jgi:hypothetical protein